MNVQHIANGRIEQRRRKAIVASLISFLLLFTTVVSSSAQSANKELTLKWTDTGVYKTRPVVLERPDDFMFGRFPDEVHPVFPDIPTQGQILLPMPKNVDLPTNWTQFTSMLYKGMKEAISKGMEEGIYDFEIRTVQNISFKGGYWNSKQQERCVHFTDAFLEALSMVKNDFANGYNVNVDGVVGSNGGYVATKVIPMLAHNPLNKLIIIDGRAYVSNTIETVDAMNHKIALINTAGDAPSLPDMVAHHKGAKKVKHARPEIIAVYVDPKGWNLPGLAHIAAMEPERKLVVKYFTCNGYTTPKKMKADELIDELLTLLDTPATALKEGEIFYRVGDGSATVFTGTFIFRHIDEHSNETTKTLTLTQDKTSIKGSLEVNRICPHCCELDSNCCGAVNIIVPVTGRATEDEPVATLSWSEESDEINKPEPGDFIFGLPRCIVSTEEGTFPAALRDNGKVLILKGCQ